MMPADLINITEGHCNIVDGDEGTLKKSDT